MSFCRCDVVAVGSCTLLLSVINFIIYVRIRLITFNYRNNACRIHSVLCNNNQENRFPKGGGGGRK